MLPFFPGYVVFAANKTLEKKVSEGAELKTRLEAELKEKIKKMEKELENVTMKASGKHCCKSSLTLFLSLTHACTLAPSLTT